MRRQGLILNPHGEALFPFSFLLWVLHWLKLTLKDS
jgi:hypothetical protein